MNDLIQADGITIGKSEKFALPPLKNIARAVTTVQQDGVLECNNGKCDIIGEIGGLAYASSKRVYSPKGVAPALKAGSGSAYPKIVFEGGKEYVLIDGKKYRVRRFTERERFRLMGVKDEDYEKIAKNQSRSSLCHLSGDSIVVDVLMAIFREII